MFQKCGIDQFLKALFFRLIPGLGVCLLLVSCFEPPSPREIAIGEYNYCMSGDISKAAFPDENRINDCVDASVERNGYLSAEKKNSADLEGCWLVFFNKIPNGDCEAAINEVCATNDCFYKNKNYPYLSNIEMKYTTRKLLINLIDGSVFFKCNKPGGSRGYGGTDVTARYCDLAGLMYGAVGSKNNHVFVEKNATYHQKAKARYYFNKSCVDGYDPPKDWVYISPCRYLLALGGKIDKTAVAMAVKKLNARNAPLEHAQSRIDKVQGSEMLAQELANSQSAIRASRQQLQGIIRSLPNVVAGDVATVNAGLQAEADARSTVVAHSQPHRASSVGYLPQLPTSNLSQVQQSEQGTLAGSDSATVGSQTTISQCGNASNATSISSNLLVGLGHCAGENALTITNNSSQNLNCHFRFSDNTGGEIAVRSGQTIGGEGAGMWECHAPGPVQVVCVSDNTEGMFLRGQCKLPF